MSSSPRDGFRRVRAVTGALVAVGVVGTAAGSVMAYTDTHISQAATPPSQVAAPATDQAGVGAGSDTGDSGSSSAGAIAPDPSASRFGVGPQLQSGTGGYHAQSSGS